MAKVKGFPFMKTQGLVIGMLMSVLFISCKTPAPVIGVLSGDIAPEISALNSTGSAHKLSDSKGKLILVEFWDSYNTVARKNHFEMQRMYGRYKDVEFKEGNGFEIFSLSIDADKAAWSKAVKEDGITWPIIVNDSKAWNATAVLDYKIASLPKYFLINDQGIIINHNIIISDLEKILESLKD